MNPEDHKEIEKLRKEKRKASQKNNLKEVVLLCNCIGELLAKNGKYNEAITEHEEELSLSEALEDKIGCAVACRKIGECYCGQEKYEQALKLQQRHLTLAKSCDNLLEEQRAWATIGRTYLFQIETSKGKDVTETSTKQAKDAFFKSLEVCEKLRSSVKNVDYMEMKARLYLNLGLVFDSCGDLQQCAEFMKKAISISQQHSLHSDLYRCQVSLASMYQRGGNLSQAQRYLEAAHMSAIKLKDKSLEGEVLSQKAIISLLLGDYSSSKHVLKKAYRLGAFTPEEKERLVRNFKAVSKIEEASSSLNDLPGGDSEQKLKLYEIMGDCSAEIGNFKQALEYYTSMMLCAETLQKSMKEMIPIYVSLAQTYADDKQMSRAIEYYNRELMCRGDDQEQMCRTWLNIAECQEQKGDNYDTVGASYIKSFDCARKAKHRKLQVYILRSLIEVQKAFKKTSHHQQTQIKRQQLKEKYNVNSDDELSEEERDSQRSDDVEEDGNLSIDDLTESDHDSSSDEENGTKTVNVTARRTARRVTTKRNEKGETPLHRACIEGNLNKVKKLIEQGHPVNPRDYCGWIPLHEAANHDHFEIVDYLLEHGAAVNDRGGQHCGGVTPLIDAANCGNLEVMRVLMTHNANILAKDDEGNTALSCLRQWRERCDDPLESHVLAAYEELEGSLSAMVRPGVSVPGRSPVGTLSQGPQRSRTSSVPDMPSINRPNRAKKAVSMRRAMSSDESDSDTGDIVRQKTSVPTSPPPREDDSEEMYPNPILEDRTPTTVTSNATESYRQAISQIGSSAARRKAAQPPNHTPKSRRVTDTTALISADDFVDDDWLVDDLQPMKRRKIDGNGGFATGFRQRGSQKERTNLIESDSDDDCGTESSCLSDGTVMLTHEPIIQDGSVINSNQTCDDHQDVTITEVNEDFTDDFSLPSLRPSSSNRSSTSSQVCVPNLISDNLDPPRWVAPSRPRQTRMTQFGTRQTDNTQNAPNTHRTHTVHNTQNNTMFLSQMGAVSPGLEVTNHVPVGSVLRLKVRVKDKLLLVPAPNGGEGKTISWLAHEASQRYYSLCGLRPFLTLVTGDDAFLAPDDPISLVLSTDEEVQGRVDSWDMPPLSQRYEQACKTLHSVSYRNIRTILQHCDMSGKLELRRLALGPAQVLPVFRAIQCQSNLKELDLTANRVGDNGLEGLLRVLCTLPNLTTLCLAGNAITSVGVQQMADTGSASAMLQSLTSLDLSHNPLGDSSCQSLAAVISRLPSITTVSLCACDLTAKFFQQHRVTLATALQGSSLQNLDVSCNRLGALGTEQLLRSISAAKVVRLTLGGNMTVASGSSHLLLHLQNYLSQDNCALQELDISSSQLCSDDVDFILRLLVSGKHIQSLRLSANPKLTNLDVRRVLEIAARNNARLDELTVEGCGLRSPLDTPFLDSVCDKLACSYPLKTLTLTCAGLDKVDVDSLSQIWSEQWKDVGKMDVHNTRVKLWVIDI